jgi:hypothetical protein
LANEHNASVESCDAAVQNALHRGTKYELVREHAFDRGRADRRERAATVNWLPP